MNINPTTPHAIHQFVTTHPIMGLFIIKLIPCLVFFSMASLTSALLHNNDTDKASLLAFKSQLESSTVLSSWNDSSHFCDWDGVVCGPARRRVLSLDLQKCGLKGTLSPHIGNLSLLSRIMFQENKLQGPLPQELGSLTRLVELNVSYNLLQGKVPGNLSQCSMFETMDLSHNQLGEAFPVELTSLSNLKFLGLNWNDFGGSLSPSFGNLSSLEQLHFVGNKLSGGIPYELGRLQGLTFLAIASNHLSGVIPLSLYNVTSLEILYLPMNQLEGRLNPDIGLMLPNLQWLDLLTNNLEGPIPMTLANASKLDTINLGENGFSGRIPDNFSKLKGLQLLELSMNNLMEDDSNFNSLSSLTNCSVLEELGLNENNFTAQLPGSISNLSTHLSRLTLGWNNLYGSIPMGIVNLVELEFLILERNSLTGHIPAGIWNLPRLQVLGLGTNNLLGTIPSPFCNNSRQLFLLGLGPNNLEGAITASIGQCDKLSILELSGNRFNGTLPREIFTIPTLTRYLGFSFNSLSGPLPPEIGQMVSLGTLNAENNRFSGEIPSSLGSCRGLTKLYLGSNAFQGSIPSSFDGLSALEELDVSCNNLSGSIPDYLESFKYLYLLNLSFNNLEGEVPKGGVFQNSSAVSLLGNKRICGGPANLHLQACTSKTMTYKQRTNQVIPVLILVASAFISVLVITFIIFFSYKRARKQNLTCLSTFATKICILEEKFWKVSYHDLHKATKGFSVEHLIGKGRFASVYKATFEGKLGVVAVKVLNNQVSESSNAFLVECNTLGNIRHRNLVRILTSCASLDHKGNIFTAILFKYMANGSLDNWLHNTKSNPEVKVLNVVQRLNVAIDVATALDYLHNQCDKPIIHCDLKPCNVLLDNEMVAHVADFGLAKVLHEMSTGFSQDPSGSVLVQGTIGYVPPEYGLGGQASVEGDVFAYGILLLEMFTGKRPTNDIFVHGLDLRAYVEMAFPEKVFEIIDRQLQQNGNYMHEKMVDFIGLILQVGVQCSTASPHERPGIKDVMNQMHKIRNLILKNISSY